MTTNVTKAEMTASVKANNRINVPALVLNSMDLKVGDPIKIVVENKRMTVEKL